MKTSRFATEHGGAAPETVAEINFTLDRSVPSSHDNSALTVQIVG